MYLMNQMKNALSKSKSFATIHTLADASLFIMLATLFF